MNEKKILLPQGPVPTSQSCQASHFLQENNKTLFVLLMKQEDIFVVKNGDLPVLACSEPVLSMRS